MPERAFRELAGTLANITTGHDAAAVVRAASSAVPDAVLWPSNQSWIDECFAGADARKILGRLQSHADERARAAGATLAAMSPTAVAVTLRALRRARDMTLAEVLQQDLVLSVRFADHPDFPEGIRAQIIDKDRNPAWNPRSLNGVMPEAIDAFFAPPPPDLVL